MSDSVRPQRRQPTRLPRPWDSPGKNTGVGCHFLLQCMKVKCQSEVVQSCPTQRPHGLQPTRLLRPWDFSRQEHWSGVPDFILLLLLLLLSCFSRVQLCVTPQMAAHQAPPPLGFSRQEHWSGLPFPSPMHESEVAQSCPTLSDPMHCSLPGSSTHGIFQARVLEWGAIAFSGM